MNPFHLRSWNIFGTGLLCAICFIFMWLFEASHQNVNESLQRCAEKSALALFAGGRLGLSSEMVVYGHYSSYFCNAGVFDTVCGVCMQLMLCYTPTPAGLCDSWCLCVCRQNGL